MAGGAAFTFGYTEQAELLEAAGARVAPFDPLRDEDLPEGTAGLILGGGFPEMHAAGLSANGRLRERVAALAGGPRWLAGPRRPVGARRSPPSARGCSTWPGRWTTGPCAASSTCGPR